ncbi:LacI family DNA-binding transcriptional regulator [Cellulomonas dongxiuzhuiae]|uniref:LacI family transcriptional regulator n=1 Tax=Cellulomonas dongxiuzhuiae TaxID=2819979 RepID=A0ABX8GMZ0_9CELL|nr:LacI family DNA-binding transcriptional regulator [Cellulomonas dongxiuzhuiae]MBO3093271.1 LacI family DNA-binding transcriptional regulator [Cellulomonas dongxiuzhuiae]QWC17558.1 LacI family transcriptional regulator [Cellulomonas dongxiuzhuiae]
MHAPRATSRDVARLAGVAQSTVSYVLAGKGSISPETRERVRQAAEQLHYQPNLAARAMRTRRTGRVAAVMGLPTYNPAAMLAGASAAAQGAGYLMDVLHVDGSIETRSERVLELARSGQFEGVLSFTPLQPAAEDLAPTDVPVVVSETFDDEMHAAGELVDASPVVAFVEHLAALGHARFLHVAGPSQYASAVARRIAYLATVERLGLTSLGVVEGDWSGQAGLDAILSLPEDAPPLAVIASNDLVAVGVMRGAAQRGWSVPGDVSVTGWDNADVGPYLTPSLTTVDTDRAEAGRRAMRQLVAALRQEAAPHGLPPLTTIVWRESTAPPADRTARP